MPSNGRESEFGGTLSATMNMKTVMARMMVMDKDTRSPEKEELYYLESYKNWWGKMRSTFFQRYWLKTDLFSTSCIVLPDSGGKQKDNTVRTVMHIHGNIKLKT